MKRLGYTQKEIKDIRTKLETYLKQPRVQGINLTDFIPKEVALSDEEKPRIIFSDKAAKLIKALVARCSEEIAWNCTVTRRKHNVFYIDNVVMFPQIVTGTSVDVDETEYANWLATLPEDVFNRLRFHGHSHVNMAVNPSGIDTKYQADMFHNLTDFYIYMIFNKRGDMYACIYDIKDMKFYERNDIIIQFGEKLCYDTADQLIKQYVKRPPKQKYEYAYNKHNTPGRMSMYDNSKAILQYEERYKMTPEEIRRFVDHY